MNIPYKPTTLIQPLLKLVLGEYNGRVLVWLISLCNVITIPSWLTLDPGLGLRGKGEVVKSNPVATPTSWNPALFLQELCNPRHVT